MSTEATTTTTTTKKGGPGEFFIIDARTWARVCALGMKPAVAYLVLARFSGRDNVHTAASVKAIEKHTGIARGRAREAIQQLIAAGLVRQTQGGTKPRYELAAFAELPGVMPSPDELAVHKRIGEGKAPTRQQRAIAERLLKQGWATRTPLDAWCAGPLPSAEPEPVWLPNALVTSAAKEPSPVERVRQTTDVMCLRLLVDLYSEQNLRDDGGVSRKVIFKKHERTKAGEHGAYIVWGFKAEGRTYVRNDSPIALCHRREPTEAEKKADPHVNGSEDFFKRLTNLERVRLIDWTPYLCDSEAADAEIIHPLRFIAGAESKSQGPLWALEVCLAVAADEAGSRLLNNRRADDSGTYLVPVRRHVEHVAVVSVARLHYRPRTRNTSDWWTTLMKQGPLLVAGYDAIGAERALPAKAAG